MTNLFQFGENHPDYAVRVLNEREARGGAGILFLLALTGFLQVWFKGDFAMTAVVIVGFFIDFFVRVLINPRYAPSLVLARFFVRHQTPEYVGAPQKRFAWAIGLVLAAFMFYFAVIQGVRGPLTMLTCVVCLLLLFFETAFGICLGCKLYSLFTGTPAQLCPGDVCEVKEPEAIQRISWGQGVALFGFVAFMAHVGSQLDTAPVQRPAAAASATSPADEERCRVPEFAKRMGHEQMWKQHNGCL